MKQKQPPKPGLFGLLLVLLILFGSPTVAHAQDNAARASWKSWEQKLKYDAIYYSNGDYVTETGEGGHKMYHVQVAEAEAGIEHAVIYNDIGEVYNYRTVRVTPWAIAMKSTLKDITFADCCSNTAGTNAYAWISIDLANECFADNKNLEAVYMKYKMYAGDDHTIMLKPKDVRAGKNIFWNNKKPKIYVDWEYYQDYLNDSKWGVYKDQIVPTTTMREAEKTLEGVGYARDHVEDGMGSFRTESAGEKYISYAHVIGASETDISKVNGNILIYNDYGWDAPYIITRIWSHAYDGSSALKSVKFQDVLNGKSYKDMNITIGDYAFANCPNLLTFDLVMKVESTKEMKDLTPANIKIGKHVFDGSPNVQIRVPLSQKAAFEADENWKEYAHLFVPYVEDITKADFEEGGVHYSYIYDSNGKYVTTKVTDSNDREHTLYHVKANSVDNDKDAIVVYNDIGTAWNYRTMLFDNNVLNGKNTLKTISFADCVSNIAGTQAWVWPRIELGKTSMQYCQGLEEVQMKYKMYAGDDHAIMLRPGTVVPQSGFSLEGSPNAKILVDPEYYTSYMNAPEWQGVKDRIVSTPKMREAEFKEYGMQYARDNNEDATGSYKTTTSNNGKTTVYKVHVIGPDADYIKNHDGIAYLYKDIGQTYAYTTTKIWSRSFDGCEDLKSVKIYDIMPSATKNFLDLNIEIGDSAFVNCPNLKIFDVVMNSVDEKDHFEVIHPSQMPIGKDVFAGSPKVRIRVASSAYTEFLNDEKWSQYANLIEPYDFEMADYKEGGAIYSMWRTEDGQTFYSSKDVEEMEKIVEPWAAAFRNLEPDKLLALDTDETLWYTHITGLDDDYLKKHDGELRIYNDIGTSYDFKTLAIDSIQLRGNENIKKIVFEDCASGSENANTMLKMVIHNGAFKDCKNLKELNMFYLSTKGTNEMKYLTPEDVYIGENVFDGVDKDFRIVVAPEAYTDFITDANWGQYKEMIVACDYVPTAEDDIVEEGVTYGYAANTLNSLPTSTVAHLQSSMWNLATLAGEVVIAVLTDGLAQAGISGASTASSTVVTALSRTIFKPAALIGHSLFIAGQPATEAAYHAAIHGIGLCFGVQSVLNTHAALAISSNIESNIRHNTWMISGSGWILTENKHPIYHMYVKDVDDSKTDLTIYNDIGTAYNYSTIGFGDRAFWNKTNLMRIGFKDQLRGDTEARKAMCIAIPDSCFLGCSNLRMLDLVLKSNEDGSEQALGPENFLILGDKIFEGCHPDLKIRIGRERLDDFLANETWQPYKNMFEVVDIEDKVSFEEKGVQYAHEFENASRVYQTFIEDHTIEHLKVVGATDDIDKQQGEVSLWNDIGRYNNYKLDRVKYKAFYNNPKVKGLSFWDVLGGDAYTNLNVTLQDSCFADCKNLEYVNMLYMVTDGFNTAKEMLPDSVHLGKGVFDGCDKLKIKMMWDATDKFLADSTWASYKDKFLPCFFKPADEEVEDALDDAGLSYKSPISDTWDVMDATQMKNIESVRDQIGKREIKAFEEFKAFETVGLERVPIEMFRNQKNLQLVKIPSTVKTICQSAFEGCGSLPRIEIPESVTSIENSAFKDCSTLKSIRMMSSVPATLSGEPFAGLPSDYVIYVPDTASVVAAYKEKWPEYADHIQEYKFKSTFKTVTVKEAGTLAKELGFYSATGTDESGAIAHYSISGEFSQYDSLKIVGPLNSDDFAAIRSLGGRTPIHCNIEPRGRLKYLDLSDADIVKGGLFYSTENYVVDIYRSTKDDVIGMVMFEKLPYLETLILPNSAKSIDDEMAWKCPNLKRIVFGPNINDIEEDIIQETPNLTEMIFLGPVPKTMDKEMFYGKASRITAYTTNAEHDNYTAAARIYNNVDTIATGFEDDRTLQVMAKKGIYLGTDLANLNSFENVVNGEGIGKFMELIYALNVTTLGDNSLNGCSDMDEVSLPYNLKSISADAFKGCTSLNTVYGTCSEIPTLAADAFRDLPSDFVIIVPMGKEDEWREAWKQYADHIIGYRPDEKSELTEVTLTKAGTLGAKLGLEVTMDAPDNVGRISGDYYKIKGLKVNGKINGKDIAVIRLLGGRDEENAEEVTLSRMTYLDLYNAEIVTDPAKICYNRGSYNDYVERDNEVPENMFWKLDNIRTLILPKKATKINEEACYDMLNLKTVVIGDETTYIDNDAFGECPGLENMVFLCNKKAVLHEDAFRDPASDKNFQVKNMYVPFSYVNECRSDKEYTEHSMNIWTKYPDDGVFRAYGRKLVMTDDDLQNVSNIDGWFDDYDGITDLTSLSKTVIDSLKTDVLAKQRKLQKISLPKTLTTVQEKVFANNGKLAWADFTRCSEAGASLAANADKLGAGKSTLVYMPTSFGSSDKANVVYGSDGARECARYELTDSRDYEVPMEFTAKEISYDRDFKKRKAPYTVCLPFDCDVPAGCRAYTLSGRSDNELIFTQVSDMEGEKPYLILAEDADAKIEQTSDVKIPVTPLRLPQVNAPGYSMLGTLSYIDNDQAAGMKAYVLQPDAQWHPVSNDGKSNIAPYRAFIQVNGTRSARAIQSWFEDVDSETGETVLKTIDFDGSERYYDLNGRKLNAAPKQGVYIHNGKKVVGY